MCSITNLMWFTTNVIVLHMHEIYEDTCHGDYNIIEGTYSNVHTIQNPFKQHENLQDATNKEYDNKIDKYI